MNIRALKFFVAVVNKKNFLHASKQMFVSQPAISKAIRQMEEDLNVILLHRQQGCVEPTAAGKVLYSHAINIINELELAKESIKNIANQPQGILKVGLPTTISSSFFIDIIQMVKKDYPLIDLKIIEQGSKLLTEAMLNNEIDIAAIVLPVNQDILSSLPFYHDKLMLVVSSSHELAQHKEIEISALRDYSFVSFSDDYKINDIINQLCLYHGFTPQIILKSNHVDFIFATISSSHYIGLLPASTCHELIEGKVKFINVVGDSTHYQLGLVRRKDKPLSATGLAWLSAAQRVLTLPESSMNSFIL